MNCGINWTPSSEGGQPSDLGLGTAKVLGGFSVDKNRNYSDSVTELKYISIPENPKLNLLEGLSNFIRVPRDGEQLEFLLLFIRENFASLADPGKKRLNFDVVCYRGSLLVLLCTPVTTQPWCISAMRYRGTLYLYLNRTEYNGEMNPYAKKAIYSGRKFEQFILTRE